MCFRIFSIEHDIEKIINFWLWVLNSFINYGVAQLIHLIDVVPVAAIRKVSQLVLDGCPNRSCTSLQKGICHMLRKGMNIIGVELVEAVIEGAQSNSVKR